MKPEQFIREQSLEKARDLLNQRDRYVNVEKPTHFDADLDIFFHIDDITELDESDIDLSDLKRLVESIDLIKSYGGIERCRKEIEWVERSKFPETDLVKELKQAIADYESIYRGGDE